jgi:CheY-like chemotaxis protein
MAPSIFVVDDDEDIREVLSMALTGEGFAVETARDGAEALARLLGGLRPSIVLLDLMMPGLSGEDLVSALRRDLRLPLPPILVMSADTEARRKASALRAVGCLVKPFEFQELFEAVRRIATEGLVHPGDGSRARASESGP